MSGPILVIGALPKKRARSSSHSVLVANPVRALGKPVKRKPRALLGKPVKKKPCPCKGAKTYKTVSQLKDAYEHDQVSPAEYKVLRARILKAKANLGISPQPETPAAKAAAPTKRTSVMKKGRTAAQKAATKRMIAANKRARKHNPAKKATKKATKAKKKVMRGSNLRAKGPKSAKSGMQAALVRHKKAEAKKAKRSRAAKKAARTRAANKKTTTTRKPRTRKTTRKTTTRRAAPKKTRKTRKVSGYRVHSVKTPKVKAKVRVYKKGPKKGKRIPKRKYAGTFINTRTGRKIRLTPNRRHNPMFTVGNVAVFATTTAVARLVAELADRWIATSPVEGGNASYGALAVQDFSHGANWKRLAASGAPAAVFGTVGVLLAYYNKTGLAAASLGAGFGFAMKFVPQATMRLLGYSNLYDASADPAVNGFKGYLNRLLPEGSSTNNAPNVVAGIEDVGPIAQMGVGRCGCGCGGHQGTAHAPVQSGCPKARTGEQRIVPPSRRLPDTRIPGGDGRQGDGGGQGQKRVPLPTGSGSEEPFTPVRSDVPNGSFGFGRMADPDTFKRMPGLPTGSVEVKPQGGIISELVNARRRKASSPTEAQKDTAGYSTIVK